MQRFQAEVKRLLLHTAVMVTVVPWIPKVSARQAGVYGPAMTDFAVLNDHVPPLIANVMTAVTASTTCMRITPTLNNVVRAESFTSWQVA